MGMSAYRLLSQLGAGRDGVAYRALPLAGGEPVALASTVAGALVSAHRLGLVHGGLDPWAIRGAGPGSIAIDFTGVDTGSGPQVDDDRSVLRESFRAPEVRAGEELSAATDLFSLG